VRASSLLRQLAKGGCAARRLSWVTPGFSQSRRCKTTASAKLACLQVDSRGSPQKIEEIKVQKNIVVKSQQFEQAAALRDKEKQLQKELETAKTLWEEEVKSKRYPINEEHIAEVVHMMTGIPVKRMVAAESEKLRGTELEFVIMVIAVSCVKLLSAHNSTQHTSRKHKV
jgi:ATPases with chaperone activity, ATP-binding subunit